MKAFVVNVFAINNGFAKSMLVTSLTTGMGCQ
jgi:hypothetical protein